MDLTTGNLSTTPGWRTTWTMAGSKHGKGKGSADAISQTCSLSFSIMMKFHCVTFGLNVSQIICFLPIIGQYWVACLFANHSGLLPLAQSTGQGILILKMP